jgi:antitoxin YefM
MSIPASNARANFFKLIEQVNDDQEAIVITSNAGNAVLVSESEWENMLEMQYLLSTPANRDWIMKSIEQADRGQITALSLPLIVAQDLHKPKVAAKPAAKLRPRRVAKPASKRIVKTADKNSR